MEAPALQLNPAHPAEFEFDVQVQGLNPAAVPIVRFVITLPLYSLCFTCSAVSATKWKVTIPVLEGVFTDVSYPFAVEVIADGYHFQPAAGTIVVVTHPKVAVGQNRPTAAVAVTQAPPPELTQAEPAELTPVPEAPSVTTSLLQQVQQEAVTEEPKLDVEQMLATFDETKHGGEVLPELAPIIETPAVEPATPAVERVAPVVEQAPAAPAKPKLSIFKLKKLGQVTR